MASSVDPWGSGMIDKFDLDLLAVKILITLTLSYFLLLKLPVSVSSLSDWLEDTRKSSTFNSNSGISPSAAATFNSNSGIFPSAPIGVVADGMLGPPGDPPCFPLSLLQ